MELKDKMTYPEIFERIVTEAPKYEFCDAVRGDTAMKGFVRNMWADWCTKAIAEISSFVGDADDRRETVQFLTAARKSVMTDVWDKASESVRSLVKLSEKMDEAVIGELVKMMEDSKVPFDVLTKEESELPFVPVEYERD